jgi:sec-independent protein translocase protein TatC
VAPVLLGSTTLFYFGVVFAYMGVVPKTIGFLLSFAGERLTPVINVTQYFMFVAKFCFAFGVVFQLPLVVVMLSALGLVSPQRLWKTWRYGILIIFVFAAWLTPPDAVSQVLMAGPIIVLYLASIGLAFLLARRRRRRQ